MKNVAKAELLFKLNLKILFKSAYEYFESRRQTKLVYLKMFY